VCVLAADGGAHAATDVTDDVASAAGELSATTVIHGRNFRE